MCVVSMIGDHYRDTWFSQPSTPSVPWAPGGPLHIPATLPPAVTRAEFDALKQQVAEMVVLLKRAKLYDEQNNEPDCEIEEKMELLRKVARLVGVDLDKALHPTT